MKDYDHKRWLAFLQRAAELPLHYSLEELQSFKETADALYPSISPLISACITLAKGDVEGSPTMQPFKERIAPSQMAKNASRSAMYVERLMDPERFSRNSDLLKFAHIYLPDLPNMRFDKMSRSRIAQTIAQSIVQAPKAVVKRINEDLEIGQTSESASEFLTTWERTIKNG